MSVLNEKLIQAQAAFAATNSALILAKQNFARTDTLYAQKAETQANWEAASNSLKQANTNYDNANSNVKQAQINLDYAKIYSPIDGVILNRAVDAGQTVAASFNTPTLFLIANDLTKMEVQANMDEADVGGLADGQKVIFTVDAYPDDVFDGTVEQIRLQPHVTSNVVTYAVMITAPNPEEKLFPGMTANVSILVDFSSGLTVPAEALFFIPDEKTVTEMGIEKSQLNNGRDRQVWMLKDNKLVAQRITTGVNDGLRFVVREGISEGDVIVLSLNTSNGKRR
jgi:HlyD family secretion protein